MLQFLHPPRLALLLCGLFMVGCTTLVAPKASAPDAAPVAATGTRVSDVALLGVITVPNNTVAFDMPVGGLSAIAYDDGRDTYYFLSDDRAMFGPTRIYAASIDMGDGTLDDGDLIWTGMIPLHDENGNRFAAGALDPEGLVYTDDTFYVSTEGDAAGRPMIDPAILHFSVMGEWLASLPLPNYVMPVTDGSRGVRNNQGFESLTLTPDGRTLISGMENALAQDGPAATLDDVSPARLLTLNLADQRVAREVIYSVDAIPAAPQPASGSADNGLVDLIALDSQGTLLALERSYAQGVGNTVRLYVVNTQDATDVSGVDALIGREAVTPIAKTLLVDFGELGRALGVAPDNLEGMVLGPQLADGRTLLLVVSDNNFNASQTTQLWALALEIVRDGF